MILTNAKILINERIRIKADFFLMELAAPEIAQEARAGQFMMLTALANESPFLKRPMGINAINKQTGSLRVIYQLKGKGTKAMSHLRAGEHIEVLGPLGNGWKIKDDMKSVCLVGGGSGIATLLPLAVELQQKSVANIDIILGGKSAEHIICLEEFSHGGNTMIATEDGSLGQQGMVDIYFRDNPNYDMVFSCGPTPMMRKAAQWALSHGLKCQVSLEERMGCGYGVCMGCVCETKDNNSGHICYKRVCKEGPVFAAEEVFFND